MSIIAKQLQKVKKRYQALKEYKEFIEQVGFQFTIDEFNALNIPYLRDEIINTPNKREKMGKIVFECLIYFEATS